MSSLAYADPAIEIPAYIHWPQPEKPQRPVTLWVTLGVAAVVFSLSGASVVSAWSHMPDIDVSGGTPQVAAYADIAGDYATPTSKLVTFTPPSDYNASEAPVVPAVYDVPAMPASAVQLKAETRFDDGEFAALMGGPSDDDAPAADAPVNAVYAPSEALPDAPIPYESLRGVSAGENIPS